MPDTETRFTAPIRPAALLRRHEIAFDIAPDPVETRSIAQSLDLIGLRQLRFTGVLRPDGQADWRLDGRLQASATQACVVSLNPVVTPIDTDVRRHFVADWTEPGPGEHMMRDDDDEPLGRGIDLGAVLVEALALALPDYPRAAGVAPPREDPNSEPTHRPFAGLKDRLTK